MKIIEEKYAWARTNFTEQDPDTIDIHHALSPNCTAQDVHRWHLGKGWKGIAYHYFIRKNGATYRGRQENHEGGGLFGSENKNKIEICLEGCYTDYVSNGKVLTEKTVPEAQLKSLVEVCNDIKSRRAIKAIKKHADYPSAIKEKKDCPGKYFPWGEFMSRMSTPTIMGESELTVEQMRKFLRDVNPDAPEVEQLFLDEGNTEGVRGDIAFCQAIHETDYFRFTGQAKIEWNNPAGLGVTGQIVNGEPVGNKFPDWRTGIRAQIQHLKAYAVKNPTFKYPLVDPRYEAVKNAGYIGTAPTWTDLNGKWAYPGKTYGQSILKLFDRVKSIQIDSNSEKVKLLTKENEALKNENSELRNDMRLIAEIVNKY
jgi:N-acetyl-anhydromuramyl-L-alanine amidase AmpD